MEHSHEMNSKYRKCGSLMNDMKNLLFEIHWCECIFDHLAVTKVKMKFVLMQARCDMQVADVLIYTVYEM
jgi:hypothetical protein